MRKPAVAAVFVTDRHGVVASEDLALARQHGLTTTEAKVALTIARGLPGKQVCRELHISYNTLKTHLRHIYAKTRVKRQSDLVRLLAGGLRIASEETGGRSV